MTGRGEGPAGPALPVLGVFVEALGLAARHSGRLFLWSLLPGCAGLAVAGAAFLDLDPATFITVLGALAAIVFVSSCAFSVRVHRHILLPSPPGETLAALLFERRMWRYAGESACAALLSMIPAAAGAAAAAVLAGALGLPPGWTFALEAVLPLAAAQACLAGWQLVRLTSIPVRDASPPGTGRGLASGHRLGLAGVALLNCGYAVGVSLFAGWLVGLAFPYAGGDESRLELFTLAVGLPAQFCFYACLQAACFRRLAGPLALPVQG